MVEERDVADGQSEDLDLAEFLVGRQGGQHAAKSTECGVERLDADALPGGVRRPVALRRPAVTASFLSVAARTTAAARPRCRCHGGRHRRRRTLT